MDNLDMAGQPWEQKEEQQLIKEYLVDKLNLLEICENHKRNPGGITSRLKLLKLVDINEETRGYSEYLKSDLYKEILKNKQIKNKKKKAEVITSSNFEITILKNEILSLKKDVKEILRLMNELYEFESQ